VERNADSNGRRAELLSAAAAVIARVGFDRVRFRDVAEEAGVSIGMLQHHFKTREQLGREAFVYVCRDRAARITEASARATTAWEQIETYLREALDWPGLFDRARTWLDICAAGSRDPALKRETALIFEYWRSPLLTAIEAGTANGELRPIVTSEAAADAILALIDGTEVRAVGDDVNDPQIAERTLETTLIIARHLLAPTAPSEPETTAAAAA
jgi:AcrR family transcriptional regulator